MTRFAADSAVRELGPGRYAAVCSDGWSAPVGPNGGYLAAIVLRAMQSAVGDRPPRSLTLHYLRPTAPGDVEVAVTVEREGRSLSSATARLEQGGRVRVLAVGAFAADFPSRADYDEPAPVVPEAEPCVAPEAPGQPSIVRRFAVAPVVGPPLFSGAEQALTGGWIAFADGPQALDAPALALLADAWLPAPFTRLTEIAPAPTVDLTVHFRAPGVPAAEPVLGIWRSRVSRGGFFEEDGELWSRDGVLLAQSRQLALLR